MSMAAEMQWFKRVRRIAWASAIGIGLLLIYEVLQGAFAPVFRKLAGL